MFLVVFLILEHEVTKLANILAISLPTSLQDFHPGSINDNLSNKILYRLIVYRTYESYVENLAFFSMSFVICHFKNVTDSKIDLYKF